LAWALVKNRQSTFETMSAVAAKHPGFLLILAKNALKSTRPNPKVASL
jgi:hypothetical protein